MRNLKKFLALVLAMVMIVGASAVVSADFTDVAADSAYATAINDLAVKGIVRGTSDTTFSPDADVQRYQMALFMARATTGEVGVEADSTVWANGIIPFTDVTEYKGAIQHAFLNGIIKGRNDTTFDPAGNIAYVDALTMAVRALGYTDCEYPWGFYNKAVELGLTEGVAVDALYDTLNRAETAQVIYNMIYAKRADSDVHFAAENFELDVVRTSDLFVITATPLQSYAEGYNSADQKEEGTFVGVQALVNGVPNGEVIYLPVEVLGIEASDVEDYLNYTVELVDYDAKTGKFYEAKLGAAPEKVYTEDIAFETDKNGNLVAGSTKIVIDGAIYNLVDSISGSVLKNELVAFSGSDINTYPATYLLEIGDAVVYGGQVVAYAIGEYGNTKYYATQVDIDLDADGTADIEKNTIVSEATALKAWGYATDSVEYAKYSTLSVSEINEIGGYELQLFDDDANGKYDRAIVNKVYVTVYGTYNKNITGDSTKEVCDYLYKAHTGKEIEATDVNYTTELEVGTVFTYTYNEYTNTVSVIDVVELQTAKLNKIDRSKQADGIYTLTLGDTAYTAKTAWTDADLAAKVMSPTTTAPTLAKIAAGTAFKALTNWAALLETAHLGAEYNFYALNGHVFFAEAVAGTTLTTEFMVMDSIADFDFGKLDLNLYAGGEAKTVTLNKFGSIKVSNLSSWQSAIFFGGYENFRKGLIYAAQNTADGVNILGTVNQETAADYALSIITKDNENNFVVDENDVITFENGIVRYGKNGERLEYAQRLRTDYTTVFYFINYGEGGIEDEFDTTVKAYVGIPWTTTEATITLNEDTVIYTDRIGYRANNATQRMTKLIIVVNAESYDFDGAKVGNKYGYIIASDPDTYIADDAVDFELEGYADGAKFYQYTEGAIDANTGEKITIYSPVKNLEKGKLYELDENNVLVGYNKMTTANASTYALTFEDAVEEGALLDWSGKNIRVDYLYEETFYDIIVSDTPNYTGTVNPADRVFDYDDYQINNIMLVNVGDTIVVDRGVEGSDLTYAAGTRQGAWNDIRNIFYYTQKYHKTTPEQCYVSVDADNGMVVMFYSFDLTPTTP